MNMYVVYVNLHRLLQFRTTINSRSWKKHKNSSDKRIKKPTNDVIKSVLLFPPFPPFSMARKISATGWYAVVSNSPDPAGSLSKYLESMELSLSFHSKFLI